MTTCRFWLTANPPECDDRCGSKPSPSLTLHICRMIPKDQVFMQRTPIPTWRTSSMVGIDEDGRITPILDTDEYAEDDSEWTIEEEFELKKPKEQ